MSKKMQEVYDHMNRGLQKDKKAKNKKYNSLNTGVSTGYKPSNKVVSKAKKAARGG